MQKKGLKLETKEIHSIFQPVKQQVVAAFSAATILHLRGGSICPLHVQPNLPYEKLPSYTLLVAAAVYKAIKNLTMIEVDIKWVNDIYFKNKKIAGILTEAMTSVETGLVTDVIIGLGINFSIADFPEDLKEKSR